ncbi:MAG: hypothetical protein ABI604_17570 [Nitrospirota bacterium]
MIPPNLDKIADHCSELELGAYLNAEGKEEASQQAAKALVKTTDGSQMPTRRTDLATRVGSARKTIDFDAIQLRRALARWENEGGAGKFALQRI